MKIVGAIFEKMKKQVGDNCNRTLNIEFEKDQSVGIGATLGDGQKIKKYFSSYKDFPGKVDSTILLGFECTINPQHFKKSLEPFLRK